MKQDFSITGLNSGKFYSNDELVSLGIESTDLIVCKDSSIYGQYVNENLVNINGRSVSLNLLLGLLNEKPLYDYLLDTFEIDNNDSINIGCLVDDGTIKYSVTKTELVSMYDYLIQNRIIDNNPKYQSKIAYIRSTISSFHFENRYSGKTYTFSYHNELKSISLDIFLSMIFSDKDVTEYNVDPDMLISGFNSFIKEKRILNKYLFKPEEINRINNLVSLSNPIVKSVKLKDNKKVTLRETVFLTKYSFLCRGELEKLLQIYVRMCNYYGIVSDDSKKSENNITSGDFINVFAYFLSNYNIDYSLIEVNDLVEIFFSVGEFDVVLTNDKKAILQDTLSNREYKGITVRNDNELTQMKFSELFYKVISDLNNQIKKEQECASALSKFSSRHRGPKIGLADRIRMFFRSAINTNTTGYSFVKYIEIMYQNIFNEEENSKLEFIVNTNEEEIKPLIILFINQRIIIINVHDNDNLKEVNIDTYNELLNHGYSLLDRNSGDGNVTQIKGRSK